MEPELEYRYLKSYKMEEKTHVTYMARNGKIVKTSIDHNFMLGA
jgi:hypothetical protein